LSEIRSILIERDVNQLAQNTGARYQKNDGENGIFQLPVWGEMTNVTHPDFVAYSSDTKQPIDVVNQGLLLYHFLIADGTLEAGYLISFTELPDGRFYSNAFQGYTGGELARYFKNDLASFREAAQHLGGLPQNLGDEAYAFKLFPNVTLAAICWLGDEDFPTNYQILFDASVTHHLPTDACAIAGSLLTRKIIKAGRAQLR